MTDGFTGLLALYLYSQASIEFRKISFTVLLYFLVSDLIYHHFLAGFRSNNLWALYLIYNIINVAILLRFDYLKSQNAIKLLISANILINIPMSMYFITTTETNIVYNLYYYFTLLIAILCLIFMVLISDRLVHYFESRSIDNNNTGTMLTILCARGYWYKHWYIS